MISESEELKDHNSQATVMMSGIPGEREFLSLRVICRDEV